MTKIFLDTNLLIYLYSEDEPEKRRTVLNLIIENEAIISTQVVNELSNVLYKKFKLNSDKVLEVIEEIQRNVYISDVNMETIKYAHFIKNKYKYSYFDSLMISSALENKCDILFTEDMQNNQLIENVLKLKNPFKIE